MTGTADLISLDQRVRRHVQLPVHIDYLRAAAHELREFRNCVAQAALDQGGSAREWGLACTSFMLSAPRASEALNDLAAIRVGNWPDTRWAVQIRTAQAEAERRLVEARASARSVVRDKTCTPDTAAKFGFEGARLMEALDGLCRLIEERYSAAPHH